MRIISIIGVANCAKVILNPTGLNLKTLFLTFYLIQMLTLNDKTIAQIDKDNHAKQWQIETRITEIIRKHRILGEVFQKISRIHTIMNIMNLKTVLSLTS